MHPQDFAWLWQSMVKKPFTLEEAHYLEPIAHYRKPEGHALLLLHGFSSTPAVFRLMLDKLPEYDAIVAPLLPGHGESINAFAQVRAEDWIQHVEMQYQKLHKQYEKIDVLGLSLGGVLACHLSQHFPLNRLFLLAPALKLNFPLSMGSCLPKLAQKIGLKTVRSQGGNIHYPSHTELTYRRLPLQAVATLLDFIDTFPIKPLSCKTDIFLGNYDPVVANHKIAALFKDQPLVTTHWLKNSAHILPLDRDRGSIVEVILKR